MMATNPRKGKPSRGPVRFPDSTGAAKALGISHSHLWRVLAGQRSSRRVITGLRRMGHPLAAVAERAARTPRR